MHFRKARGNGGSCRFRLWARSVNTGVYRGCLANHRCASWLHPSVSIPPSQCCPRIWLPLTWGFGSSLTMPEDSCLWALLRLDSSSPQFPDQLCDILDGSGFDDGVKDLGADDLLRLIGFLDQVRPPFNSKNCPLNQSQVLESLNRAESAFGKTLHKLQRICASRRILPQSHVVSTDRLRIDEHPFASGGYSDAHMGTLDGSRVCVKKLRVAATSSSDRVKKESDRCK